MNRRAYLAGLGPGLAGVSGCLASPGGTGGPLRRVTVVGTDTTGIAVEAETLEQSVTRAHTAEVRLTWSNPGTAETSLSIGRESAEPLVSKTRDDGEWRATGLVLVPASYDPQKESADCWKPADYFGGGGDAESIALQPGDSLTHDYQLWTVPDRDGCLPPGEYDFGHFGGGTPAWRVTLGVETP